MSKKRSKPKYTALAISLGISIVMLGGGFYLVDGMTVQMAVYRLGIPLVRLMGFITIGLAAGIVIEASGWTHALSVVARPMFNFGHLGERCSAAFTTAFVSGVTANAMLLEFYKEELITKKQLFLSNFVNQLPAYFLHLPTTFFIVLPLTGKAGAFYYLLTFLATLLRTFLFLLYGRFAIREKGKSVPGEQEKSGKENKGVFEKIKARLPARLINITVYVLPVYIAVFMVNKLGFFQFINDYLAKNVALSLMPIESLSVVILSFAAEFTSGFAAAGALMHQGLITVKQTVLALLIGNVLAFPVRAVRHQLPRYMGIFSPKMGLQILLLGQLFRVLSLIVMGIIFYLVF